MFAIVITTDVISIIARKIDKLKCYYFNKTTKGTETLEEKHTDDIHMDDPIGTAIYLHFFVM